MPVIAAASLGEASREVEALAWSKHCKPAIGYYQALHSWFIHEGSAYQVKTCPSGVFPAWLDSVTPASWTESDKVLNLATESGDDEERLLCRWFSLCGVLKGRKPRAVLYATQEEAMNVLK